MSWREKSADVIKKAIPIVEQRATDTIEIFDIIRREYYPFGVRQHFPYKAWLSEIKAQQDRYFRAKHPPKIEPPDYNTGMFAKEATP